MGRQNKKPQLAGKEKYFKLCVMEFIDFFHLNDFDITIDSYETDDAQACCSFYPLEDGAQSLGIYYVKKIILEADEREIRRIAFHEVCEGLLSELQQLSRSRFILEREIAAATHRVIRRMESCILPRIK